MWEGLFQVATPHLCLLFPLETVPGSFLTNQGVYSLTVIHRACQSHQHTHVIILTAEKRFKRLLFYTLFRSLSLPLSDIKAPLSLRS